MKQFHLVRSYDPGSSLEIGNDKFTPSDWLADFSSRRRAGIGGPACEAIQRTKMKPLTYSLFFGVCLTLAALCMTATPSYGQFSSPVTVKNTPAQAVPTKDQYNLALATPLNQSGPVNFGVGIFTGSTSTFTVPANQKLVLTYLSALCSFQAPTDAIISLILNASPAVFFTTQSKAAPGNGPTAVVGIGGTPLQTVIDPGTQVQIQADRTVATETGTCGIAFSAYLVAVP
jgi:hypothetical protein